VFLRIVTLYTYIHVQVHKCVPVVLMCACLWKIAWWLGQLETWWSKGKRASAYHMFGHVQIFFSGVPGNT